jgi:hypothetical protein
MKKTLIIISIVVAILIIGIWVYLFVFGTPKSTNDVFSNFGIGDTNPSSFVPPVEPVEEVASTPRALRQLTTRPVAGATLTTSGIRYVERGTGHIYTVSQGGGNESLVSGTTIPRVVEALFSADGTHVAITTEGENSDTVEVVVGTIESRDGGTFTGKTLPEGAHEVAWDSSANTLQYLLPTQSGSAGYSYAIATGTSKLLFEVPLRDIKVLWGDTRYVYTSPSAHQSGSVYRLNGNALTYAADSGVGLMALRFADGFVVSRLEDRQLITTGYIDEYAKKQSVSLLPEKCVVHPMKTYTLICASPFETIAGDMPDDWYKGITSFADWLYEIDVTDGSAVVMSDFLSESGREIDVSQIGTDPEGKYIWFINKNDDTLWMYDTTMSTGS